MKACIAKLKGRITRYAQEHTEKTMAISCLILGLAMCVVAKLLLWFGLMDRWTFAGLCLVSTLLCLWLASIMPTRHAARKHYGR